MQSKPFISIQDHAIENRMEIVKNIKKKLGPHPIKQSDPRTKGLIAELEGNNLRQLTPELSILSPLLEPYLEKEKAFYIVAVNQNPPGAADDFLLRPHIDRRWVDGAFSEEVPSWTMVMFLDFDPQAHGGELLVFPDHQEDFIALGELPKEKVRSQLNAFRPSFIHPIPGRVCQFSGGLPHAVMGYELGKGKIWRMSLIIACFEG